jgi:acyl-CoA synthetase (AMP-forming)/AMP-acid ligase II
MSSRPKLKPSQLTIVIGVADGRLGQVGKAFVVLRSAAVPPTVEDVLTWSRQRMAGYKVPRYVQFVDELPTNATGKVVKDLLR